MCVACSIDSCTENTLWSLDNEHWARTAATTGATTKTTKRTTIITASATATATIAAVATRAKCHFSAASHLSLVCGKKQAAHFVEGKKQRQLRNINMQSATSTFPLPALALFLLHAHPHLHPCNIRIYVLLRFSATCQWQRQQQQQQLQLLPQKGTVNSTAMAASLFRQFAYPVWTQQTERGYIIWRCRWETSFKATGESAWLWYTMETVRLSYISLTGYLSRRSHPTQTAAIRVCVRVCCNCFSMRVENMRFPFFSSSSSLFALQLNLNFILKRIFALKVFPDFPHSGLKIICIQD